MTILFRREIDRQSYRQRETPSKREIKRERERERENGEEIVIHHSSGGRRAVSMQPFITQRLIASMLPETNVHLFKQMSTSS